MSVLPIAATANESILLFQGQIREEPSSRARRRAHPVCEVLVAAPCGAFASGHRPAGGVQASRAASWAIYLRAVLISMSRLACSTSRLRLNWTLMPRILPECFPILYCFFNSSDRVLLDIASRALSVK